MTEERIFPPCRRWRRRKEARPGEILEAALELFAEKGFAATRLNEVADRAGISKGTLYLYFDSKEALFQAVIREMLLPQVEQAETMAGTFTGTTHELLRGMSRFWRESIMNSRLSGIPKLVIAEAGNFPDLARFYYENVVKRGMALAERMLRRGIERGEFRDCNVTYTARVLLAPMVFAAIWEHSLRPFDEREYDVGAFFDAHLELVLTGLAAVPTA